jgi:hypothetical protein
MKTRSIHSKLIVLPSCFALLLFLAAPTLRAQAQEDMSNGPVADDNNITADETHNPPSRVARISVAEGSVSVQPGGTGDWGSAVKNRPVTIGDKLWVDKDSRAELQAGQAAIHLGSMSALSFLNLDQNIIQMRLPEGHVNFRVRELRQGETYEVDTPNAAFTVKEAGAFRIDVNENGDLTSVTAIRGSGEVAASGQVYPVNSGQRVDLTGPEGNVQVSNSSASGSDDLDRWAQQRDLGEDNSTSGRYVNRDTVGYSDLDDYGTWREEPEYGNVWVPNDVGPDWAPYSDGYWSYVGPWGWTWVDYEPWGFAPFHYGRWQYFGSYWGWCPGPIYSYPYYGPAFVGFLGGFGFGVGFGWGGGYGWFPLGWGEPFRPWYRCGFGYWRNVNIHNTYINNFNARTNSYRNFNYAYAHNPRAVTVTSHSGFVNGHAVNRGGQRLTAASLRGAHVMNGVKASPTHSSYFGANNTRGRVAIPSAGIQNRSVVARTAPAAAASHMPVRTMNNSALRAGRAAPSMGGRTMTGSRTMPNAPQGQGMSANRMSQLSANRPPNASRPGNLGSNAPSSNVARPGNSPRTWSAQGNRTDSGRAPQGFGGSNRPSNTMTTPRNNSANRPPWAGSGNSAPQRNSGYRPPSSYNNGRSHSSPNGGNRSYNAYPNYGNRSNNAPSYGNRSYSPPSYNGNRGYSAPRSYSPPSYNGNRGYSAPRSYGGGSSAPRSSGSYGGGSHGGGGGSSRSSGGGGGSHGGGGGGSHGSSSHH